MKLSLDGYPYSDHGLPDAPGPRGMRALLVAASVARAERLELRQCGVQQVPLPNHMPWLRVLRIEDDVLAPPTECPPRLHVLDLVACGLGRAPVGLPDGLKELRLSHNEGMQFPPDWAPPPRLELLELANCGLAHMPQLPNGLRVLSVGNNGGLQDLGRLPPGIEQLWAPQCNLSRPVSPLPLSLMELDVGGNSELGALDAAALPRLEVLIAARCGLKSLTLPPGLRELRLTGNSSLALEAFPLLEQLEVLHLSQCRGIRRLEGVGRALRELVLGSAPRVELPADLAQCSSLEVLVLWDNELTRLPPLPHALVELDVTGNADLRDLGDEPLPESLRTLTVMDCGLERLPARLPAALRVLCATGNRGMDVSACVWPAGLEMLLLAGCDLTHLPAPLPDGLTELGVGDNPRLRSLGARFPPRLQILDAGDCALTELPAELPSTLKQLLVNGNRELRSLGGVRHLVELWMADTAIDVQEVPPGVRFVDVGEEEEED